MIGTLPPPAKRKLEQTLAQWRSWQCSPPLQREPRIAGVLGPGLSNYSVLVEADRRFVVRIDGINPAHHGLNRQMEWRTLRDASATGLAPTPRYFNPELGTLVCDYLPPDEQPAADTEDVARLLRAIHQLPPRHHRLDLKTHLARYEKRVMQRDSAVIRVLQRNRTTLSSLLQTVETPADTVLLCHNDLLAANRIHSGGQLRAVDWEYCAMASPWYDIAVVIEGDDLPDNEVKTLLNAYLDRTPSDQQAALLGAYRGIYSYIETLWYLALERPVYSEEDLLQRATSLETKLQTAAIESQ